MSLCESMYGSMLTSLDAEIHGAMLFLGGRL